MSVCVSQIPFPEKTSYHDLLPKWAYVEAVAALAEGSEWKGKILPMSICVGPCLIWGKVSTAIHWLCAYSCCLLTYCSCVCEGDVAVLRPNALQVCCYVVIFTAIFPVCAFLEFMCLRYTTVPFVQVTRRFAVFGHRVPFLAWLAFAFGQSTLLRADMLTDGIFVGELLVTEQCPGERLTDVWEEVLINSSVPFLAYARLSHLVLFVYSLTVTQCLWPVMTGLPRPSCRGKGLDYHIPDPADPKGSRKLCVEFSNIFGEKVRLGDAMMMMAEAGGMSSLQLQSPAYPFGKAALEPEKALGLARAAISRGVVSIGLVACLENSMQIHFQVSSLALNRFLQGTLSPTAVMSIILSMCMLIIKLKDARSLLRLAKKVRNTHSEEARRASEHFNSLRWYTRIVRCMVALLLASLILGVAKLTAVFTCKDSFWNLTGCVDLEALS